MPQLYAASIIVPVLKAINLRKQAKSSDGMMICDLN
jgi:hypothetical protein